MELRVLTYFLAVAREQSIVKAAKSLHLSQPTLSTQIRAMEEELGKQLLVRGTKGSRKVTLTEEGMILRKRAEEILSLVQKTEREISLSDQTIVGDVYIGAGETDAVRFIARTARELYQIYPGIHYHISSGNSEFVTEQLDKGLIDFGIVFGNVDHAKYHSIELPYKDLWGVLMKQDSPLAEKTVIEPKDLWNQPLIISSQEDTKYHSIELPYKDLWGVLMKQDSPLAEKTVIEPKDLWNQPLIISSQEDSQATLTTWIQKELSELEIVATYNLLFNASLMVEEGLGYAVGLDKIINTSGNSNLCFRPLSPRQEAGMHIIWKKYQVFSKASEKFIEKLKQC